MSSRFHSALSLPKVVFALLSFGIVEGLIAEQPKLFLAPDTLRPQFDPPVIPPRHGLSGSRKPQPIEMGWISKEGKIGRLTGRHDQPLPGFPEIPPDIFLADEDQRITLPNGEELWIDSIEMMYQTGPGDSDVSFEVFDGMTLLPLSGESNDPDEKVYGPTLKLQFKGPRNLEVGETTVQFANGIPFRQNGRDHGYWDSKTKRSFEAPLYSMPVVVTSEFRFGEEKTFSIPLEVNAVYRNDDFEVRVIACSYFPPGAEPGSVAVGERGKELQIRYLTYQPEELNDGRTICCLEFVPIRSLPRGFKRKGGGLTWFGRYEPRVEFLQIENSNEVPPKTLEFTYRDRALAVFQLPKIPGIPKENEDLSNIFDLKVPFVKFEDATDHFWFIANHAGLDLRAHYERYPYPEVTYPISYTNVTLMEMIEDWRKRYKIHEFKLEEENVLVEISKAPN